MAAKSHRQPVEIDEDITCASTLPGWFYADPAVYRIMRERVFPRSWQLVADTDAVKIPGQTHPFTFLEGCLDEPLVLVRDERDGLHCLSNVCTHRGTIVVEHGGRERCLTCRYHGRRFRLDGTFEYMPEFQQTRDFPTEADNLPRIPFAAWRKFIFANLDRAAPPIEETIGDMAGRCGWLGLDDLALDATRCKDYLVRANWALYVENYLEGFHIPFVHASLNEAIDYGSYRTEIYARSNLQRGIAKGAEECFAPPPDSPDHGQRLAAYYWWLFPNTMFNFYPWGVSVNIVRPLGPELTRVSFLTYVMDRHRLDKGAGAGLDRVEREDEAVVEAVQRGVRSRLYHRGRYSPTREQGVHHFHRLLACVYNEGLGAGL